MRLKHTWLILAITIFCFNCEKTKAIREISNEEYEASIIDSFHKKSNDLIRKLDNRNSVSIYNLLTDSLISQNDNHLIMVFSLYDCGSCVTKGLAVLDKFKESKFGTHSILSGVLFEERVFNDVKGNYVHDKNTSIIKELGYFPTPALIHYNVIDGIKNLYLIPTFEDSVEQNDFETSLYKTQ
jgi:hypothetical protein